MEQIFSRAGLLSDPNLLPAHLMTLVKIGYNKKACCPSLKAIKEMYYAMFRGKGEASDDVDERRSGRGLWAGVGGETGDYHE